MNSRSFIFAATSAITLLSGFAATAQADTIDITAMLESTTDVDSRANALCLGNKCNGSLESAHIDYGSGSSDQGTIHARLRLHNVQEQCVNRPFGGHWCWDVYNYWVSVDISATVDNCSIGSVVASSNNTLYAVPAVFADLFANSSFFKMAVIDKNHFPGCQAN